MVSRVSHQIIGERLGVAAGSSAFSPKWFSRVAHELIPGARWAARLVREVTAAALLQVEGCQPVLPPVPRRVRKRRLKMPDSPSAPSAMLLLKNIADEIIKGELVWLYISYLTSVSIASLFYRLLKASISPFPGRCTLAEGPLAVADKPLLDLLPRQ